MIGKGQISVDDPREPDVRALLERHLTFALEQTPPEHSFALDSGGLLDPAITFFSFRLAGELLGVGAIKRLSPEHAEIKSMHTAAAARGRGVGRAMLAHLLDVARARGYRQVSLETGTMEAFAPARSLYQSAGFTPCEPFGDYERTEDNCFMTLALDEPAEDTLQGALILIHSGLCKPRTASCPQCEECRDIRVNLFIVPGFCRYGDRNPEQIAGPGGQIGACRASLDCG